MLYLYINFVTSSCGNLISPLKKILCTDLYLLVSLNHNKLLKYLNINALLDIDGKGEEDPDGRADEHKEEEEDGLPPHAPPAHPAPPQLVQVTLNLQQRE